MEKNSQKKGSPPKGGETVGGRVEKNPLQKDLTPIACREVEFVSKACGCSDEGFCNLCIDLSSQPGEQLRLFL